jgi:hypothetical protein
MSGGCAPTRINVGPPLLASIEFVLYTHLLVEEYD